MENKLQFKFLRDKLSLLLCLVAFLVCAQGAWADAALGPVGIYMDVNNTKSWYKIYHTSWDYKGCTGWQFNGDTYLDKQTFGTVTSLKISGLGIIGWISPNTSGDWVATEARYWFDQSSEPSSPNKYNVGGYDATGACPEGQWACVDSKDNGKDVVIGSKSDVDILLGLAVGDHTLYVKPYLEKRYNGGGWDYKIDCAIASATFTVPGYSTTSGSKAFGNVNVGENSEVTISTTHYGSTTTAKANISGDNADQFSTSDVTATSFKVKFTPTSAGEKSATVTVTDAYDKTYTLTVTGTGVQACTPPTAYAVSGTATICSGSSTNVTVANSQTGYTYKLYKGGTATSTTKTGTGSALNFSVSEEGTYTVKGYKTGSESCSTDMSGTATVTVYTNPTAGFAISAGSTTPEITTNSGQTTTTLTSSASNVSSAPYKEWYCTNAPSTGAPTFSSASTLTPTVTFHKEGTFKFKLKAGCSSTNYVESAELTVTVSGKLYIKGPVHDDGCWPGYNNTAWESSNGVYTNTFTAYKKCDSGSGPSEFVLSRATSDNNDKKLNGFVTMNFDPDAENCNWEFSARSGETNNYKVKESFYNAGDELTITVTHVEDQTFKMKVTKACTTPTKDDFTVSENSKTYNGSAQTATVAVKSGITGMGNLTVKYDGSASQTNVGTYPIAVDVDAGTTYCSASNISLGNFVINPATPTNADFTYSIPANKTFDDAYAKATVSARSGVSGMGAVTVKYNGATAADGVKNAGTYNVTFDVAAGTNYTSATGLVPTPTSSFTISKAAGSITITNDKTSFCQDAVNPTVTSTRTGDGTVTYEITVGGDKADINASTGVLTYKAPGTFTVRATVAEGTNHLTASAAKEFTFVQAPNAGTLSADVAVCSGKSTILTTTGSFGTLQWKSSTSAGGPYSNVSGGSGATTASYTTAALTQTTYYKVEATNGVCSATLSATPVTVTVNANPTLTIDLTSSPGEGLVYEWEWATFEPNTTGTITAKSINRTTGTSSSKCVFGGEGNVLTVKAHPTGDVYQASYTATSNGCSTTVTKDVTVTKVIEVCP